MSGENMSQRTSGIADGNAHCQWERTTDGSLIAKWHRGRRAHPCATPHRVSAPLARTGTDRRRASRPGRRARQRLRPVAMIVAMYLVMGLGLFSVFVAR
jgi:hypothetical protein